ncbi:PEPxxWA-CTERM sorting domain-containing protein [Sphingomonas sp. MMS24-J13]|uniref:Npun_F0296 family exosortase-dependent surface protein n=1 Tax=Sphingomonas sp. MMS24-J13 TaxID=3238686 RepID=UPI0038515981
MVIAASGANAAVPFDVRYESELAGMTNTSATFSKVGVETFDGKSSTASFATNFGGSPFTGTYSSANGNYVQINGSDQYGGAGNSGKYAVAFNSTPYSLTLDQGVTYFGYWLSALDAGNTVTFYSHGTKLFTFDAADALHAVDTAPSANKDDYYGKPGTGATRWDRANPGEPYIFLDFFANNGLTFDKIEFAEKPTYGGGYELDNHTVGLYTGKGTGTEVQLINSTVAAVPEPASWAMMLAGFGFVGSSIRRRKTSALRTA